MLERERQKVMACRILTSATVGQIGFALWLLGAIFGLGLLLMAIPIFGGGSMFFLYLGGVFLLLGIAPLPALIKELAASCRLQNDAEDLLHQ